MQTVTLPDLQSLLPAFAQAVLEGECLVILIAGKKMLLHLAEDDEAAVVREPGYLADCQDDESIAFDSLASNLGMRATNGTLRQKRRSRNFYARRLRC